MQISLPCLLVLILMFWTKGDALCEDGDGTLCKPAMFNLNITNWLIKPFFGYSMRMKLSANQSVIRYMEQAVLNPRSKFTGFNATFYRPYGYYIASINGRSENYWNNRTYWEFITGKGSSSVGVSNYYPKAGETVLLNFTVDAKVSPTRAKKFPRYMN